MNEQQKINRDKEYAMELMRLSKREFVKITAKEHATMVRKALKAKWPHGKFSVVSDQFAGGNSVTAYVVDEFPEGVDTPMIREFVNQFCGYRGDNFDMRYNIGFEYEGVLYRGASFCNFNWIKRSKR